MIDKVGAVVIKDRKMLVVREKGSQWFFIPGGRREGNESDEECLRREIREELGAEIEIVNFYNEFVTKASGIKGKVKVRAYFCKMKNKPKPGSEIEEFAWADGSFDKRKLGNVLKVMIPQLKKDGRL